MKYRKLRIAWSVSWGFVAVLICVLWVRSLGQWENLHGPLVGGQYFVANSIAGEMSIGIGEFVGANRLGRNAIPASEPARRLAVRDILGEDSTYGFGVLQTSNKLIAVVPHWFLILLSTTLAAMPWLCRLRWRFSLRTLLIATTLVAVVLGLIVWASRR